MTWQCRWLCWFPNACYTCHPFFLVFPTHLQPPFALCEFSQASPEEWPMAWSFPSNMRPARWQFPKMTINQMDAKLDKFHSETTNSMSQSNIWLISIIDSWSFLMGTRPLSCCLGILSVSSCLGSKVHTCTSGRGRGQLSAGCEHRKHEFTIELR